MDMDKQVKDKVEVKIQELKHEEELMRDFFDIYEQLNIKKET
jgi:hypothetical protein